MYRYREQLTSILASAMLTSALFPAAEGGWQASVVDPAAVNRAMQAAFSGASAEGWQTASLTLAAATPAPVVLAAATKDSAAVPKPAISPEKLQVIIDVAMSGQKVNTIPEPVAQGLGLAHPFTTKSAGFERDAVVRRLNVGLADPTRMIFVRKTSEGLHVYASSRRAELVSAGTYINNVFTPVALDVAKPAFEAELRMWDAEPIRQPSAPVAGAPAAAPGA